MYGLEPGFLFLRDAVFLTDRLLLRPTADMVCPRPDLMHDSLDYPGWRYCR
jgi:hypothetical protein